MFYQGTLSVKAVSEGTALLPTISVVLPARNERRFLPRALRSLVEQDYPLSLVEAVVVDNASTDRTAQVALNFAHQHPELRLLVVREPVPGAARAKNTGALAASGQVLMFLDADSRLERHALRTVAQTYMAGHSAGCLYIAADSQDLLDRAFFWLVSLGPRLFGIRANMFYCDRQLFLDLGGFLPDLQQAEDKDFLQRARRRLASQGKDVIYIQEARIFTSPRRLRYLPLRLGMVTTFCRWLLANFNVGRRWPYPSGGEIYTNVKDVPRVLIGLNYWLNGRKGHSPAYPLGTLTAWRLWEKFTDWRDKPVPVREGSVLRYALQHHQGHEVKLSDGTVVRRGDLIAELHIANAALYRRLAHDGRTAPWRLMAEAQRDLLLLDAILPPEVVALHGLTLVHPAARRIGFDVFAVPPGPGTRLVRFFMMGLLALYHPRGVARVETITERDRPAEVWLSRNKLRELAASKLS